MTNEPKKPQRTKGNVKPSSSSKAARLLSEQGLGSIGFVGFGENLFEGAEMNPNFHVCFRKLMKKDSTTKLKALKELTDLVAEAEQTEVSQVWQFWTQIYAKISLDDDIKVRVESHSVLSLFYQKLGRQVAGQIKSIMPYLLLGESDPYSTVSRSAKLFITQAFPTPQKRRQALLYCKEAIIAECADIIQSAKKYGKIACDHQKNANEIAEESDEFRVHRLNLCALKSLTQFLRELGQHSTCDDDDDLICVVDSIRQQLKLQIFDQPKFWNLMKNKSGSIKSAWLEFVASVTENFTELSKEFFGQICPILTNHMEKQEISVCKNAWDCILVCLDKFPETFWTHVNIQKVFLPKIYSILRKSGENMSAVLGPAILPLLSKILANGPLQDPVQFCWKFLQHFEYGFRLACTERQTKFETNYFSETISFIRAYCECVKFLTKNFYANQEFMKFVLIEQVPELIKLYLSSIVVYSNDEKPEMYQEFALLLEYLLNFRSKFEKVNEIQQNVDEIGRNVNIKLPETTDDIVQFEKIVENFAKILSEFVQQSIENAPENSSMSSNSVNFLLTSIKILLTKLCLSGNRRCLQFVADILRKFSGGKNFDENQHFLRIFDEILKKNSSKTSTKFEFLKLFYQTDDENDCLQKLTNLLTIVILGKDSGKCDSLSSECINLLFSCLFNVWDMVDSNSRMEMLQKLIKVKSPILTYSLLNELSKSEILNEIPTTFLHSDDFAQSFSYSFNDTFEKMLLKVNRNQQLEALTSSQLTFDYDWRVYAQFLSARRNDASLLPAPLLNTIFDDLLKIFQKIYVLPKFDQHLSLQYVDLISNIALAILESLHECFTLKSSAELILALFDLYVDDRLTDDLRHKLESIFEVILESNLNKNLPAMTSSDENSFIFKLARLLFENLTLFGNQKFANFGPIHLADSLTSFFRLYYKICLSKNRLFDKTLLLIRHFLPNMSDWRQTFSDLSSDVRCRANANFESLLPNFDEYLGNLEIFDEFNENFYIKLRNALKICIFSMKFCQNLLLNSEFCDEFDEKSTTIIAESFYSLLSVLICINQLHNFYANFNDIRNRTNDSEAIDQLFRSTDLSFLDQERIGRIFLKNFMIVKNAGKKFVTDLNGIYQLSFARLLNSLAYFDSLREEMTSSSLPPIKFVLESDWWISENMGNDDFVELLAVETDGNANFVDEVMRKFENIVGGDSDLRINSRNLCKYFIFASKCDNRRLKTGVLSSFMTYQQKIDEFLIFSKVINDQPDEIIFLNVSIIQFFESLVDEIAVLTNDKADCVFCSLIAWLQSCAESDISSNSHALFFTYVLKLFNKIHGKMNNLPTVIENVDDSQVQFAEKFPFIDDWNGFFLESSRILIVNVFSKVFGQNLKKLHKFIGYVQSELASSIDCVDFDQFLQRCRIPVMTSSELNASKYPENYQSILLRFCPLLLNERRSVQMCAFNILKKIIDKTYEFERKSGEDVNSDDQTDLPVYLTENLSACLKKIRENSLQNVDWPGKSISTAQIRPMINQSGNSPNPDSSSNQIQHYYFAYFLTWRLMIKFLASISAEDRPQYSQILINKPNLLKDLLFLLFADPRFFADLGQSNFYANRSISSCGILSKKEEKCESECKKLVEHTLDGLLIRKSEYVSSNLREAFFMEELNLNPKDFTTPLELKRLACNIYFEILRLFPAAVRQWWNSADKKLKSTVEKFTAKYVSPLLCSLELKSISEGQKNYDKMTVNARIGAREIVAAYKMEDLNMELIVALPLTYPLNPVSVDATERVGVSKDKWRKWMLQLTVFLTRQNGSVLDGLLLWKRCVDKHLDGVEECTICMMAMHGSNYQLPKITCRQCKKKFHSACLYKWFDTSNKSTCPMCRTDFSN